MNTFVLDVGGSCIKYALMDHEATIIKRGEIPTPLDTQEHFIDAIVNIYEPFKDQVNGIAMSLPGNIDSDNGYVYTPGALLYNANTNIVERIQERINVPITVENDGKSAALAELWNGNLKDCDSGVVLIIGTGIGGGIILDRKLVKGKHFFAGEVSYLMSDVSKTGFINAFAMRGSTFAMVRRCAELKGMDVKELDGRKVFGMIEQKDKEAIQAFDEMTTCLSAQIYNLQCLLDVDRILLGGGISKDPKLLTGVKQKLDALYDTIPFAVPKAEVMTCQHFNDSNLIGALYHYQRHEKEVNNEKI